MKTKQCEICNRQIRVNNFDRHVIACSRPKVSKKIRGIDFDPNRGYATGERQAWNKGLSKETNDRVKAQADAVSVTYRQRIADGSFIPRRMGAEARQRLSEKQSLHNTGGRSKWFIVGGKSVQGTYEKQFAEQLEAENVPWEKVCRNNQIFKYVMDNRERSYAPDFYLPTLNLYVEIKGFWWGDDERKMYFVKQRHSDKHLVVLFGKDKLDYICGNITTRLAAEPTWTW